MTGLHWLAATIALIGLLVLGLLVYAVVTVLDGQDDDALRLR